MAPGTSSSSRARSSSGIRLDAGGTLPIERALRLVRQACEGVAVAHKQNVVHRALSPRDVLVTSGDVVKVVDFGSAIKYGVETTRRRSSYRAGTSRPSSS